MTYFSRALLVAALLLGAAAPVAAQTVRFQTNVGAFDMLLNPTNNPDLQPLVDNMLANVAAGVYGGSVVNRAPDGFVLQLGGFTTDSIDLDQIPFFGFRGVDSFAPVTVDEDNNGTPDFDTTGLNNSRGTVSLALSAGNLNSGSSSFFINVGNNTNSLDPQGFVPFAEIADMAAIDRIMALDKIDISNEVNQPGSLAYIDVPLTQNGDLVIIEGVGVISESNFSFKGPLLTAFEVSSAESTTPNVASLLNTDLDEALDMSGAPASLPPAAATTSAVPEPGALCLALLAGWFCPRRR